MQNSKSLKKIIELTRLLSLIIRFVFTRNISS